MPQFQLISEAENTTKRSSQEKNACMKELFKSSILFEVMLKYKIQTPTNLSIAKHCYKW